MKHISIVQQDDEELLKEKVNEWIKSNEESIVEIVAIEYTNRNTLYVATITYLD
ncbi:MAG: hypothetical protein PHY91_05610 [Tissierellia bacterium]|nr:hypothetical protein [Tissierellia bacterium]MDD4725993.1 hypothetical protein [Tissierellia bacterium]